MNTFAKALGASAKGYEAKDVAYKQLSSAPDTQRIAPVHVRFRIPA